MWTGDHGLRVSDWEIQAVSSWTHFGVGFGEAQHGEGHYAQGDGRPGYGVPIKGLKVIQFLSTCIYQNRASGISVVGSKLTLRSHIVWPEAYP